MGFNKEWARKHSKAEFIEQHKHHESDFDLGQEWEDLQEKTEKAAKPAKPEKPAEESK